MKEHLPRIHNCNVSVKETDGKMIFMRKSERGSSEHSFDIHVAEIAGMPRSIVGRASTTLRQLEADDSEVGSVGKLSVKHLEESREDIQLNFFRLDDPTFCQAHDEVLDLDINNLMPMEALNKLDEIKKIIEAE